MSKVLQVFYGKDNLPYKDKERQVHFPIVGQSFQGASNTTEIRFYYEQILSSDIGATWVSIAKLPNGKIGSQILSENVYDSEVGEHYVKLDLSSFYTQYKGDLYISLQGYRDGVQVQYNSETEIYEIVGTPVIEATGSIKLAINYSTQPIGSDIDENITIQELLGAIANKLDKNSHNYIKVVDTITQINTSTYKDYISSGDIVYTLVGNKVYSISGTYPNLTYDELPLKPSEITTTTIKVNNELRVVGGLTKLTFGENGDTTLQQYLNDKQNKIPVIELASLSGTINDTTTLNSLAVFPSYLTYEYGGDKSVFIHCRTDSTYYYFRKLFKESIIDNTSYLIYGGDIYIQVDKSTGVYSQQSVQHTWYSKAESDTLLNLKADKSNTYTKAEIDTKLTSMLVYKGTKTVAELNALAPTLSEIQTGWFYNVSDSGTLNAGNVQVLAGDNVAWTGSGWDKLTMDLTQYNETFLAAGFLQASPIDSVPEELEFDENGDITNPNWTGEIAIDYMSPPISDISISDVPETITFDLTQNYDNMITNANWTGVMTITY